VLRSARQLDRGALTFWQIIDGDQDVNLGLVEDGMCWWYRKYANEPSDMDRGLYEAAERDARGQMRGLWSDPKSVAPWDWRRR